MDSLRSEEYFEPLAHFSRRPRRSLNSFPNNFTMTSQPHSRAELAHDVLRHARRHPLEPLFAPRNLAIIGATEAEHSVGRSLLVNLTSGGFPGKIFPVNPKRATVLGQAAYPKLAALPEKVDLAV